jgi:hypothetical protein
MQTDNRDKQNVDEGRNEYIPGVQEKATLGGAYNTGVTSDDPEEKEQIEKQGTLANLKPKKEVSEGREENTGS